MVVLPMEANVSPWGANWVWSLPLIASTVAIHSLGLGLIDTRMHIALDRNEKNRTPGGFPILIMGGVALCTTVLHGPDGELMSVKWKIYKTILRYSEGVDKPIVKPQFPMSYDLSSDPHEDWNLFDTRLDNGWMFAPVFRHIIQYEMSVKKYPSIKPGEEFKGY